LIFDAPIEGNSMIRRALLVAALILPAVALPWLGSPPLDDSNRTVAFAWFDSLGLPDFGQLPFVQITNRGRSYKAFLLKDEGQRFTILTVALETRTYTKTGTEAMPDQRVGYKSLDLKKDMTVYVEHLRKLTERHRMFSQFGQRISEPAKLFLLARACAAQGHQELAQELWVEVKKAVWPHINDKITLLDIVTEGMATAQMWQAVEAFGDVAVSRQELQPRLAAIAKRFPQSKHAAQARHLATLLLKMIAEDEAHARLPGKALKDMTKQEHIAELIFRLRDQHGVQWTQPGGCDIFYDDHNANDKTLKSPAGQLVDIGYDAVPALIEVLGDERLTRSVGFHRDYYFSHHVLRVGDCAIAVLARITGRSFWVPSSTFGGMVKDGEVRAARKKAEAWWKEFQHKGEQRLLIEGTEAGDAGSAEQADRLIKGYPEVALQAIRKGTAQAKDASVRGPLVRLAGQLPGDATLAFLLEELRGPVPAGRLAAARCLLDRGHTDAVPAMIEEWHKNGKDEPYGLVSFLLCCGKEEAVQALAKDLRGRPVDSRLAVLRAIDSPGWDWDVDWKKLPVNVQQAIDAILVAELDDTEQRTGMSGAWHGKSFSNPRLCDISGLVLSLRWNLPDSFNLEGSLQTRDRQRIELMNLWRNKQRLPPLPLPVAK
jgi:hypothetical protein